MFCQKAQSQSWTKRKEMIIRNRSESEFLGGNNEGRRHAGGRVLVLAPEPFYEDRGTPIAVQQVLIGLSHLGYEVDVVTYPIGRDLQMEGVKIFRAANVLKIRSVPIGIFLRKMAVDLGMVAIIC